MSVLESAVSWEALGVYLYFQQQKEARISPSSLIRPGTGRDRAYRILNELEEHGLLERQVRKSPQGRFEGVEYRLRPLPQNPDVDIPQPENPEVATPLPANPEMAPPATGEITSQTQSAPLPENPENAQSPFKLNYAIKESVLTTGELILQEHTLKEDGLKLKDSTGELIPQKQIKELKKEGRTKKRDAVAELSQALGLTGWQTNYARVAVREERTRTAWYHLARRHPSVLKASYRLLDKTGERGTVTWASWLPLLVEDVQVFGEGRVEEAIEATIRQATPRGAWNYYRARVEDRPQRKKEDKRQESSGWEELEAVYRFSRGVCHA